jgi:hypothetical protein
VANTAANPALTSRIDDPGRIPYSGGFPCQGGNKSCFSNFGYVPPNHRLVIEEISGNIALQTAGAGKCITGGNNGSTSTSRFGPSIYTGVDNDVSFHQGGIHVYVDQNQQPTVECVFGAAIQAGFISVNGYLLDCNAAPCAAIANF